uniref:TLC domain-containing protein n=1 Tax=Ciona savignyi TaxID=51511 RepID=H2Y8T4_CIOSA
MVSQYVGNNLFVMAISAFFFYFIIPRLSKLTTSHFRAYQQLPTKFKIEWHNRNVSTTHAVLVTILAIYVVLTDTEEYEHVIWSNSKLGEMVLSIVLGYIFSDLVYLMKSSPSQTDAYWGSVLHHLVVVVCFSYSAIWGCCTHFTIVRTIAEMSTPFVNMRWTFAMCEMKNTKYFVYNGIMMVVTFFLSRILMMPYVYLRLYQLRNTQDFQRLAFIGYAIILGLMVDCLNIYWFARMLRGMIKYLRINSNKKE